MSDLPDRILAAIVETERVEHVKVASAPWHPGHGCPVCLEPVLAMTYDPAREPAPYCTLEPCGHTPDREQLVAAGFAKSGANESTLRRCEADKRTVERHASNKYNCGLDDCETHGHLLVCAGCAQLWPCPDLLDRAAAYDVEAP